MGGLKPHFYCLPILKREEHRQALLSAVQSGCRRLFLGTDSAPHVRENKECKKGCAGGESERERRRLLQRVHQSRVVRGSVRPARLFGQAGGVRVVGVGMAVESRENGADFYGLPRNEGFVELKEGEWRLERERCEK